MPHPDSIKSGSLNCHQLHLVGKQPPISRLTFEKDNKRYEYKNERYGYQPMSFYPNNRIGDSKTI